MTKTPTIVRNVPLTTDLLYTPDLRLFVDLHSLTRDARERLLKPKALEVAAMTGDEQRDAAIYLLGISEYIDQIDEQRIARLSNALLFL